MPFPLRTASTARYFDPKKLMLVHPVQDQSVRQRTDAGNGFGHTLNFAGPVDGMGDTSRADRKETMQVLLHSDPNTDGRHKMQEHLESVVNDALGRFAERITRVEAHLSDAHSALKASPDDIHCTLEARVVGMEPVVVKDHAGNAHQAIEGAVRKLKRAVTSEIEKHDPRSHRTRSDAAIAAPDADPDSSDI
jgi:ribosome-associated translation inhibitor RaiA